jgi:prepilin-type N-terminal cleavage/methylation domain-containing protein
VRNQQGFTLLEVLVVTVLVGLMIALSTTALRHYWQLQSLNSAQDSMLSELHNTQQRSVSESHPLVYGVRFSPASTATSTSTNYGIVKYDPGSLSSTSDDTCTLVDGVTHSIGNGVFVSGASFSAAGTPVIVSNCPTASSGDKFVFFYARGTATDGTLTLTSTSLGENRQIAVTGLTGRADAQ